MVHFLCGAMTSSACFLLSPWQYLVTDMAFFFPSHGCIGDAEKQRTEFEEQIRTADDAKGARKGRDTIQCKGSCLYEKHFIGVVTIGKADVYHNLACLNQF